MNAEQDRQRLKQDAIQAADSMAEELFTESRALYDDPEISQEEVRACARLTSALSREGFRVQTGLAGLSTSFVARVEGGRPGPRIGILAEYDALPEVGHACGHNLIAVSALGAGRILARLRDRLPGEVRVIGTPAEETIGGKAIMVAKGTFEGLDAAMMIHPSTEFRVFTTSLACQSIEVAYQGRSSHAVAAPDRGINALDPLVHLYLAIDTLRRSQGPEVRIPGVILEGGVRANLVPARAVGRFSIRARNREAVESILEKIRRLAEAQAEFHGATVRVSRVDETYDEMLTNRVMATLFRTNLRELGVETVDTPRVRMGSLDMGNVSQVVPSLHAFIAIVPPTGALHTREFAEATVSEQGEAGLLLAVKALAMTAIDLMLSPSDLQAAQAEFRQSDARGAP